MESEVNVERVFSYVLYLTVYPF